MRICKDCGIEKSLDEFFKTKKSKRTGEYSRSMLCKICYQRRYAPNYGKPNSGQFKKGRKTNNKGQKMNIEQKKKLSEAHLGQVPWNKGKSYPATEAMKKAYVRISERAMGYYCKKHEKWRNGVLERDKYTCQECFSTERLVAHHIKFWDEYPELRFDIDNGLTLCPACHGRLHRKFNCGFLKNGTPWNKGLKCKPSWNKGIAMRQETKQKLSDINKGKKLSEETCIKISNALRGRTRSAEHKKNLSKSWELKRKLKKNKINIGE